MGTKFRLKRALRKADIKDGDTILLTLQAKTQEEAKRIADYVVKYYRKHGKDILVILRQPGVMLDISKLDEKAMNKYGWYRRKMKLVQPKNVLMN